MKKLLSAVCLSALAQGVAAQPPQATGELAEAYVMPVWVDAVTEVCPWKSPSAEGYIRLIRREHDDGSHGLYVQWIRKGIAGEPAEAVSTLAVEELDQQLMLRLEMPQPTLARDACRLKSFGEDMVNERRYELDMLVRGPGELQVNITRKLDGGV
ncbi:MAG: hypothetical protein CSH36_07335 [Thalassolituus sp.]|nr:MAG: hypothetical protein CSH36_07335 [Thalassolituus sp.]